MPDIELFPFFSNLTDMQKRQKSLPGIYCYIEQLINLPSECSALLSANWHMGPVTMSIIQIGVGLYAHRETNNQ